MSFSKHIGKAVRIARCKAKLSQQELAALAGITYCYIGRVERGTVNASIQMLYKICAGLNCTITSVIMHAQRLEDREAM